MTAFRKNFRKSTPLPENRTLIQADGEVELSAPLAAYLETWSEFLPLGEHRQRYFRHPEDGVVLEDELKRNWGNLLAAGALLSEEAMRQSLACSGERKPARLDMIAMPSAQRPELARRGLRSLRSHAAARERNPHILLSDDSRDPGISRDYAAMVEQENQSEGGCIHLLGPEEKIRLRALLSRKSGVDPEVVDFALADPHATGFSCGANRNWILLATAGSPVLSVDDDVLFNFRQPSQPSSSIHFRIDAHPVVHRIHRDDAAIESLPEFPDWNAFEQIERWLGQPLRFRPGETVDWDRVCPDFLRGKDLPQPSVLAAFHGLAGVPLIQNPYLFLAMKPPGLNDLLRLPGLETSLLHCREHVCAPGPTLTRNSSFPGYCMGLDNARRLPPFVPVFHAEDAVQSAVWGAAWPEALQIQLPAAVVHAPPASSKVPADLTHPSQAHHLLRESFSLTKCLIYSVSGDLSRFHADPWERMQSLGRSLQDLGNLPAQDFKQLCHLQEQALLTDWVRKWVANQTEYGDDFPELNDLIGNLLDILYRNSIQESPWMPYDLWERFGSERGWREYQKILGQYGRLIQDWPALWDTVREARSAKGWAHPGLALD